MAGFFAESCARLAYLQQSEDLPSELQDTSPEVLTQLLNTMAVEPLATLSLVGSIVQFVDFSSKLFYASREISRSVSGTTHENKELSDITTYLQRLCDQLLAPQPGLPPENTTLRNLAHDCKAAGEELLVALRSLESNGKRKKRKWDNVRVALATIWKKDEIDAMSRRLESYKSMLVLHLAQRANR